MSEFKWCVSKAGYEWERRYDDESEEYLTCLTTSVTESWKEYFPLDDRCLFLKFVRLDRKRSAFSSFANSYGSLTSGVIVLVGDGYPVEFEVVDELRWPNGRVNDWSPDLDTTVEVPTPIEDLSLWATHHEDMQDLWHWYQTPRNRAVMNDDKIKRRILSNLSHRLLPTLDETCFLRFAPTDLLSVLWLQLLQAVGGKLSFRACLHCKVLFEVSASGTPKDARRHQRSDKLYCNTACQQAAAYKRRVDETRKKPSKARRAS
jgi:hypothetical protein